MNKIFQALENSRRELLDMGLRGNTLLHLRPGAKGPGSCRSTDQGDPGTGH